MKLGTDISADIDELWETFIEKKSEDARESLLIHYLPLVKIIAGRMKVTMPGSVEYDDLVSTGIIGLINSIDNFKPSRGFKFETYSAPRIKGAILDGLRDVDWLPRSYRQKSRRLDQTMEKLLTSLGRLPDEKEIADELGMDIDEYLRYIDQVGAASLVSLDITLPFGNSGESGSLHDVIADREKSDPCTQMEEEDVRGMALSLVEELNEQERSIIALYYYEALTFREIGEVIGVSESRVCQIHTRILSVLRVRLKELLE